MPRRKLVVPRIIVELIRRRVFRTAAGYVIASWALIEVASVVLEAFDAPDWSLRAFVITLLALFPVALFLSWRFDLTRSGLVRTIGSLADDEDDSQDAKRPEGISGAERRTVSVLVSRLKPGSDQSDRAISRHLEAERQALTKIVHANGGHVADAARDEVLVYFGYPVAHDDDTRRALQTGLELLSRNAHARNGHDAVSPAGIAVHTGLIVAQASDAKPSSINIGGQTVDTARRIQSLSEPGQLLVSNASWLRAQGYFKARLHPATEQIPGVESVYHVWTKTDARHRLDFDIRQGLTPLAGREQEMDTLMRSWHSAVQGQGQVVLVSGEPGIGKSRLITAIKEAVAETDKATVMAAYCFDNRGGSTLFPFVALLTQMIEKLDPEQPLDTRIAALKAFLDEHELNDQEEYSLLADLLGLQAADESTLRGMSPPKRLQRTVAALLSALMAFAGERPLLLVVEDLHFADASSLALIGILIEHAATSSVLAILSFRPVFSPPWTGRSHVRSLPVASLTAAATRQLLKDIPGAAALPDALLEAVVAKTDGVPLFIEEVSKIVLKNQADGSTAVGIEAINTIPDTLQESLLARLDQLGAAKGVAQLGAILGRKFSYRVLSVVAGLEPEQLEASLTELLAAELLYQKGVIPRATYLFKHGLIQDAAYASLLRKDRQANHARIGQLLEENFPELTSKEPDTLARHFAAGALPLKAVEYYRTAATLSLQKSAAQEAAEHVAKGLEQLEKVPEDTDSRPLELALRMIEGPALMATIGFAEARTRETYERAQQLSGELADGPSLIPVLFGLWIHHGARGELARSLELAQQVLGVATQVQDPDLLLEGNLVVGCSSFHMGDFDTSRHHFEQILKDYSADEHAHHAFVFGQDPLAAGAAYLSSVLWCLGETDGAFDVGEQAIARARKLEHPYTLALALIFVARVHQMNRDPAAVARLAGEALTVAQDSGFPTWQAFGLILSGWAQSHNGDIDKGLTGVEQGIQMCSVIGLNVSRAYFLTMAAEVREKAGDAVGALEWLQNAEEEIQQHGQQPEQPDTSRLRARIELSLGHAAEAKRWADQAVTMAQRLNAVTWELRARCERLILELSDDAQADRQRAQHIADSLTTAKSLPDIAKARRLLASAPVD